MLRNREAHPISVLFFMVGIAIAAGAFFTFIYFAPGGKPTHFAQSADNWQAVTQLYQQQDLNRDSRDM